MNKELKTQLIKYGVTVLAGALAVWGVLRLEDYRECVSDADRYRVLCDGFSVPGVLMIMFGALVKLSEEGALDGVSWAMGNLFKSLIPGMSMKKEPYDEYVARKHGEKAGGKILFLFLTGFAFAAVALIFLLLYCKNA